MWGKRPWNLLSGKKILDIVGTDHDLEGTLKKTYCFYFESRTGMGLGYS